MGYRLFFFEAPIGGPIHGDHLSIGWTDGVSLGYGGLFGRRCLGQLSTPAAAKAYSSYESCGTKDEQLLYLIPDFRHVAYS